MKYHVEIMENKTGNKIKDVLETESHNEACKTVNEYNKEYGYYSELLEKYPKKDHSIVMKKYTINS